VRFALAGVLIARLCLASDGGVERKPTVTHLRDGGYFVPEQSWRAIDAEMKHLQWQVANPPKNPEITVPLQGWIIGMAVTGAIMFGAGVAAGYCLDHKCI
jgi:hypothetical protein